MCCYLMQQPKACISQRGCKLVCFKDERQHTGLEVRKSIGAWFESHCELDFFFLKKRTQNYKSDLSQPLVTKWRALGLTFIKMISSDGSSYGDIQLQFW